MKNTELKYNLQFFGEDEGGETPPADIPNDVPGEETPSTKTYEDALSEIAKAQAEAKKLKAERDAALKKAGDATKALREKQTEAERALEEEAEKKEQREAYVKDLELYKQKNESLKRYLLQGMSSEMAEQAAQAEVDGDMDALADIQRKHTEKLLKEKEAEWKKNTPRMNFGSDDGMSKEEILAIEDREEKIRQIAMHPELFQKQ